MPKVTSKYQGVEGVFYIRNPAGAIHNVTKAHAEQRLRKAGWELATDAEIELYLESRVQVHDNPIGEKWTPKVEVVAELPEEQRQDQEPDATPKAAELAAEHGLDLAEIEGTGAEGRILVKDVEAALAERAAQAEAA